MPGGWSRGLPLVMLRDRQRSLIAVGVLLTVALALGGCSSSIVDLPAAPGASQQPKEAGAYLPVHDLPPDREEAAISPEQRAKIEAELIAARNRQATSVEAPSTQTPSTQAPPTPAK